MSLKSETGTLGSEKEEAVAIIPKSSQEKKKKQKRDIVTCPSKNKIVKVLTLEEKYEEKYMEKFFERVRNATIKVDCSPPRLNTDYITKAGKLRSNALVLKRIMIENKKMADKINYINRTVGAVDCHNTWYVRESKIDSRRPEAHYITKHNLEIFDRLRKAESKYKTSDLLKEWERNEKLIISASKFPPHWLVEKNDDPNHELLKEFVCKLSRKRYSKEKKERIHHMMRPRVFLEIQGSNGRIYGRMIIVLYRDIVPMTVANFMSLCCGDNDEGLTYKGTPFFRINKNVMCLGGDVTKKHGLGGRSIYGDLFDHENYLLKHTGPGMLTMHNTGTNCGNSQFMITFQALPTLDGKSVVFGKVIKGLNTLFCIDDFGTRTGKPKMEVIISNCGQVYHETEESK